MEAANRRLDLVSRQVLEAKPQQVLICAAFRTPLTKAKRGGLKDVPIEQMLAQLYAHTVKSTNLDPSKIEQIAIGNVLKVGSDGFALKFTQFMAGLPQNVPCYALNRMCASGVQAVSDIANLIRCGLIDVGIGGGAESLSMFQMSDAVHPPLPQRGFEFQACNNSLLPMGVTSDNVVSKFGVTREKMDRMALISNQKAHQAQTQGLYNEEIVPISFKGKVINKDDSIKVDSTIEGLGKLRSVFSENGGTTAGNSSQMTDGAAVVLLASRAAAERYNLPILGRWIGFVAVGVPPEVMGVGPAYAIPRVLEKVGLNIADIDLFQINEAFASQAVYCVEKLGIDMNKVNVKGGAIALGHPLGATGARMIATLMPEMKRRNARFGVVSMCIGSGMGAAAVIENLQR